MGRSRVYIKTSLTRKILKTPGNHSGSFLYNEMSRVIQANGTFILKRIEQADILIALDAIIFNK